MTMRSLFLCLPPRVSVQMNRVLGICSIVIFFTFSASSQTVFWTETFSNGCSANCNVSGYSGPNGAWSVTNVSAAGSKANMWFVSCAEDGNAAGDCGSGCSSSDPSLHVGCQPAILFCSSGDCGAAYNATNSNHITNKRAASPLIDCTGQTGITISFNYIGGGQSCTTDYCDLQYSSDGGTSWSNLQTCLTSLTCWTGQGLWTAFSMALPAACNNNPNVKIGFRWANNGDGAGSDPSFAVDDITLSVTSTLPIELISFEGKIMDKVNKLEWTTATETNNDHFSLQRSSNGADFTTIVTVAGAGNSVNTLHYDAIDEDPPGGLSYYRLKQTDHDGKFSFSDIIPLDRERSELDILNVYNSIQQGLLEATISSTCECKLYIELFNIQGEKIYSAFFNSTSNITKVNIPTGNLSQGVYFFRAADGSRSVSKKIKF